MNPQQLRYLVATADEGTMTAAARSLYVAQPVVSRSLRALERELGVQLLERVGRNVALTPAGTAIVEQGRRVLAELQRVEDLARGLRDRQPPLVLATTPTLERFFTQRLLPELLRDQGLHPRVVRAPSREEVASAVKRGAAEVGLTDLPVTGGLDTVPLGELEVVLVSPRGTRLPAEITIEDLEGVPLMLPAAGSERRALYDVWFRQSGVTPAVALETDERSSWTAGVLAGVGSFLWYRASAQALTSDGVELRSFVPALTRTVGVVHRHGATLSRGAARLVDVARTVGLDGH